MKIISARLLESCAPLEGFSCISTEEDKMICKRESGGGQILAQNCDGSWEPIDTWFIGKVYINGEWLTVERDTPKVKQGPIEVGDRIFMHCMDGDRRVTIGSMRVKSLIRLEKEAKVAIEFEGIRGGFLHDVEEFERVFSHSSVAPVEV